MKKRFRFYMLLSVAICILASLSECSKKGDATLTLPTINITTITRISTTSLKVTGKITSAGNGKISESGVCFSKNTGPDISKTKVVNNVTSGVFTCIINGLTPETNYYLRAYATNEEGTGYGNELPYMTAAGKFWIADALFRTALKLQIPAALDAKDSLKITNTSVTGFNGSLELSNKAITSLSGIEYFTSLSRLDCSYNALQTLDVSKNKLLTDLNCSTNQLTGLNVTGNTSLNLLLCYTNQLANLDLSKNTALTILDCDDNKLINLDLSKNLLLSTLFCYSNLLTSLDISAQSLLTDNLYIIRDFTTSRNIGNTGLTTLKVNTTIQQAGEIRNIKTNITGCTISTWSNGVQVCGNYNPITNTCP